MPGALEGVKILDLSNWIAGPFGTMLLGDLGADVIKVESLDGDGCRPLGPPFQQGESHFFMGINRNKRDLVTWCDVLVRNMRPGAADEYGFGYDTLREDHPGLIYVTNTGYGLHGPLKDMPGFDMVMQGIGGVCAALSVKKHWARMSSTIIWKSASTTPKTSFHAFNSALPSSRAIIGLPRSTPNKCRPVRCLRTSNCGANRKWRR